MHIFEIAVYILRKIHKLIKIQAPEGRSSRELHTIVAPMALIAGLTRRMRRPSDILTLIYAPPHRTVRADFPHTAPRCVTTRI
jgi:hypothetical protein